MGKNEKINILLVDDQLLNLEILASMLQEGDRHILKATSGQQALQLLQQHDVAVVVLDVVMPDMDGFTTAQRIREIEAARYVPIIFVTSLNQQQNLNKGYELGAVDYLYKPIEKTIIQSKVNVFCELHRQKGLIQKQLLEIQNQNQKLQQQQNEIKTLRGLLPICAGCKKILYDQTEELWESIEEYLEKNTQLELSHYICPECTKKFYPDFYKKKMAKKS